MHLQWYPSDLQELEKQREVVRLLTQTPDAPAPSNGSNALTPKKMVDSPRRVSHGKSASLSAIRGAESPLAAGMGSTKTRVHIPSSFTARNLALPTSPPPLPMHGKQASNAGSKKGRRLTIEADMDRLSGEWPVFLGTMTDGRIEQGSSPARAF